MSSNSRVQSPGVLKKSDGASKIGRGASTVDADLTTVENNLSTTQTDVTNLQSDLTTNVNTLQAAIDAVEESRVATINYVAGVYAVPASSRPYPQAFPNNVYDVVAIKISDDRWLIRTKFNGWAISDYAEYEIWNQGPTMAPAMTHCWVVNGMRIYRKGKLYNFCDLTNKTPSTFEFAYRVGDMSDTDVNDISKHDFYGPGHGYMRYIGLAINDADALENYRDTALVGDIIYSSSFVFQGNYDAILPRDFKASGTQNQCCTISLAHVFDGTGLSVSHIHTVTRSNLSLQNSYSLMCPTTYCDRFKERNASVIKAGDEDDSQVNITQPGDFSSAINESMVSIYFHLEPTIQLQVNVPQGYPSNPPGDWSDAVLSRKFFQDRSEGVRKLYYNNRSNTTVQLFTGTMSTVSHYKFNVGAVL